MPAWLSDRYRIDELTPTLGVLEEADMLISSLCRASDTKDAGVADSLILLKRLGSARTRCSVAVNAGSRSRCWRLGKIEATTFLIGQVQVRGLEGGRRVLHDSFGICPTRGWFAEPRKFIYPKHPRGSISHNSDGGDVLDKTWQRRRLRPYHCLSYTWRVDCMLQPILHGEPTVS